ncbi:DMT family transporter [Thiomicrospira microaerophila]|uniref:DMT family transporter n=1 Tax=Thiomicrospira microaerophila TaxID=406020 RepID=UPI000698EF44|nr:DMT family transporter [Thiomicrospira microaerophila]
MTRQHFWIGFLLAVFGTLLFSVKSIFIKLAYNAGSDADSVMLLRMSFALPVYALIAWWLWHKNPTKGRQQPLSLWLKLIALGFIGYFLSSWLDLLGLELISAQLERLTLFTYPIMVAILGALFFKQPLTRKIIFALAFSYIGIWLIYAQEARFGGEGVALGTLLVALAAFSFAFYVLFSRHIIAQVGSLWFTSWAMLAACLWVIIYFGITLDLNNFNLNADILLWTFLLALFSTVIPSFMISEAIARLGPAQTGIIGSLGPLFTVGLAVWILAEPFTLSHLFGFIFVMIGVSILTIKRQQPNKDKPHV